MKLNDTVYSVLKWLGLIALPAISTFIGVIAPVWNLPNADAIVTTVNAVGVLIGALIGVSAYTIGKGKGESPNNVSGE